MKIATARKLKGWSQPRLAQEANVSPSSIFRLEAGSEVSLIVIGKVCNALDIDIKTVEGAYAKGVGELNKKED